MAEIDYLVRTRDGVTVTISDGGGSATVDLSGDEARTSAIYEGMDALLVAARAASEHDPDSPEARVEAMRSAIAEAGLDLMALPDAKAARCAALFAPWDAGERYEPGDRAERHLRLWRCVQAHAAQEGWEPGRAPSLWAEVLPGQPGDEGTPGAPGEWVQPDSTNPYARGAVVAHAGHVWESLVGNNVWEPTDAAPTLWKRIK